MNLNAQPGILDELPPHARYLTFSLRTRDSLAELLAVIRRWPQQSDLVVGLGQPLVAALGGELPGLRDFPARSGSGVSVPVTQGALWCWLRGDDPGVLFHRARRLAEEVAPWCRLDEVTDAFVHGSGRDLTGYEDGTENPEGEAAVAAALVQGQDEGLDGSSFVAVQRWQHDMVAFNALGQPGQDHAIGRRISDNEELDDAPESAHVKRTAQESFAPEAFLLRRSMPWTEGSQGGLMFVAFGNSFAAFEAQLNRMLGLEDGIIDALFSFTRPVTGGYYWCPPLAADGGLDLRALGC